MPIERFQKWTALFMDGGAHKTPADAFEAGYKLGWDAACSAVADAVDIDSMAPPRASRVEAEDAVLVVVRVRGLIGDVARRGSPKEETD